MTGAAFYEYGRDDGGEGDIQAVGDTQLDPVWRHVRIDLALAGQPSLTATVAGILISDHAQIQPPLPLPKQITFDLATGEVDVPGVTKGWSIHFDNVAVTAN